MDTYPVVETRLSPPAGSAWDVERQSLMATLTGQDSPRVALVKAAAGYGKSALLAQFLCHDQAERKAVWATLESRDNNADQLLCKLLVAFEFSGVLSAQLVAGAVRCIPTNTEFAWTSLINGVRQYRKPARLYLDNLERVKSISSLGRLQRLFEQAPANLSFILASRCDSRLGLSRWRLKGELKVLDENRLSLTAEEIRASFANANITLTTSEAFQLHSVTGGWPAAVRLWLLAWKENTDLPAFNRTKEPLVTEQAITYITQFLQEEILDDLPERLRRFLYDTSLLNSFNEELAGLVVQGQAANQALNQLNRRHLFIYPDSNKQGWFRFHPLVRESLYRLRREQDPIGTRNLHRKIGDLLLSRGQFGEGLYQYSRSQSFSDLLSVVEKHTFELLREGKLNELVDSLARLPSGLGTDHFALAVTEASVAHVSRDIERIGASIRRLSPFLRKTPPYAESERLKQTIICLRSQIAFLGGNLRHGIRLCDEALKYSDQSSALQAAESVIRFHRANCYHALGYLDLAYDDAIRAYTELKQAGLTGYINVVSLLLGQIEIQQGRITDAEMRFQSLRTPNPPAIDNFYELYHYLGMGMVRREQNDLEAAETLISQAATIALRFETLAALPLILHHLALVCWAKGEHQKASELWQECQRLAWDNNHFSIYRLCGAYRVRLEMCEDTPVRTEYTSQWHSDWQQTGRLYGVDTMPEEQLAWAWWCFRNGKFDHATDVCDTLQVRLEQSGIVDLQIDLWVLRACVLRKIGDHEGALRSLGHATSVARRHRLETLFFREGRELVNLIRHAMSPKESKQSALIQQLPEQEYVEQQLAKLGQIKGSDAPVHNLLPFEKLTRRELDVLKLIARDHSNQQIADTLFVGVSTVKTHINSIFRKLGVATRKEACIKAARFGLIT